MDNVTIENYIKNDLFMKRMFGGIHYRDIAPVCSTEKTRVYIYNSLHSSTAFLTEKENTPLGHWTCIKINKSMDEHFNTVNEYFDPLGKPPLRDYKLYLDFFGNNYIYNTLKVQAPSQLCGHHVLYFYYMTARGIPMRDILETYTDSLIQNDVMVLKFYNNTV